MLSYYFPSKEDLLRAVFETQMERECPIFEPAMAEQGLLDVLGDFIRRNAEILGIIRLDISIWGEAHQPDHFTHDWAQQRIADSNAMMRREPQKEKDGGRLRPVLDIEVVAG